MVMVCRAQAGHRGPSWQKGADGRRERDGGRGLEASMGSKNSCLWVPDEEDGGGNTRR